MDPVKVTLTQIHIEGLERQYIFARRIPLV